MADWFDHKARWRARWQRWRGWMRERWEPWQAHRQARREQRRARMEAVQETLVHTALAKAVLAQSSQELREALLAQVWAEHREELFEQALAQVRQEQQEAEDARHERWQAQKAQERRALEKEADQLIEQGIQQGMAEERQDFEERRQRLISQREAWKARATAAEAWIVEHIQTLLPEGRRVLLRDAEIPQLRLQTLNTILEPQGLCVRAKLTETSRHVTTEVGPQRWEQRTRFWLARIPPAGVVADDEAEADEDETATVADALPNDRAAVPQ